MNQNQEEQGTENQDEVYERLKASKFKQQKLPAWRPVPTITSTTITFISFGIIFIIIGIIILIYSNKIHEVSVRYDIECLNKDECIKEIKIDKKIEKKVMVYYQLNNFYQNHRRYVKSKSDDQLKGKGVSLRSIKDSGDCDPVITNKEMGVGGTISAKGNSTLKDDDLAIPCGLIAKSFFKDTFELYDDKDRRIEIDESNIAWKADKELKYNNYDLDKQWIDMTDEHFIVWMRPSGLPNFRKLWGRINRDLEPGTYKVRIINIFDVASFGGEKHFVLSNVNAFGGKNTFLAVSYIVVGVICIILAIVFLIGYNIHQKKQK
jgi:hypothetical protein